MIKSGKWVLQNEGKPVVAERFITTLQNKV